MTLSLLGLYERGHPPNSFCHFLAHLVEFDDDTNANNNSKDDAARATECTTMDVRKEVLEYGLLPSAVLLPKLDSPTAVTDFHSKLLRETGSFKGQRGHSINSAMQPRDDACV